MSHEWPLLAESCHLKMNKYKKTALQAFIFYVPIMLLGHYYSFGIVHSGGLLIVLFLPVVLAYVVLENTGAPEWLIISLAHILQYLACVVAVIGIKLLGLFFKKINSEYIDWDLKPIFLQCC